MLLSAAMSDEKKFEWPELPYHRAILKNADTDAEGRIMASQQIHAGIMHGVGGDSSNDRAPHHLAHELTRELCTVLGDNAPELLVREIVWQVAHIFHEGTDARFYPPEEHEKELAKVIEEQLQHEHIRGLVRHWVLQTLEMGTKKEFASSLSHARTMSGIVGIELTSERKEEIKAAEIRYWEDRRTRYVEESEQTVFDEQLREHGQVPVSYLIERIHENDLTCIDNSSKGTVLNGLPFLAGIAEPLAASGLRRVAVPIPHTMQDRLLDAIQRNDAKTIKELLVEGEYATHMLREYHHDPASFDSFVDSQLEALQAIAEHLHIACVGADLRLEQDGGNSLDQQIEHIVPLLKQGRLLYFACVPFASTAFSKSRRHLTGTHASWPCSTKISLPIMAARAYQGNEARAPFCIQLVDAWQFDESFSSAVGDMAEAVFEHFLERKDAGEKFRNFTPRVRKQPYRIKRSVGVDVDKTLLANKSLTHHQENFSEAYNGVIILVEGEREDDRDEKHIHADLSGEGQRKEEFAAV